MHQSATTSCRPLNHAKTARCPPRAGTFANTSAASPFAAAWAGAPDAVMYAAANGSRVGALLALSQPAFDAAAGKLTFAVRLVPAESAALALAGGASARVRLLPVQTRALVSVVGGAVLFWLPARRGRLACLGGMPAVVCLSLVGALMLRRPVVQ